MTKREAAQILREQAGQGMAIAEHGFRGKGVTDAMTMGYAAMRSWKGRYQIHPKSKVIMSYLARNQGAALVMEPAVKRAFLDAAYVLAELAEMEDESCHP